MSYNKEKLNSMREYFRPVLGHEGIYEVGHLGTVKRVDGCHRGSDNRLTLSKNFVKGASKDSDNYYLYVSLLVVNSKTIYGEPTTIACLRNVGVHRLVAESFIGVPKEKLDVNHKNGIKYDNNFENLEWVTRSENIKHSYEVLGRKIYRGDEHWLYGKTASKETKAKMSEAKLGVNHPKFKGYYLVNNIPYVTPEEPGSLIGVNPRTVLRRCKKFYYEPGKEFVDKSGNRFNFIDKRDTIGMRLVQRLLK